MAIIKSGQIDYPTLAIVSAVSSFIGAFIGEVAKEIIKLLRARAKQAAQRLKEARNGAVNRQQNG